MILKAMIFLFYAGMYFAAQQGCFRDTPGRVEKDNLEFEERMKRIQIKQEESRKKLQASETRALEAMIKLRKSEVQLKKQAEAAFQKSNTKENAQRLKDATESHDAAVQNEKRMRENIAPEVLKRVGE